MTYAQKNEDEKGKQYLKNVTKEKLKMIMIIIIIIIIIMMIIMTVIEKEKH